MAISENFPYAKYIDTPIWSVLMDELVQLAENGDFELTTDIRYIVGATCKRLDKEKLLRDGAST